MLSWDRDWQYSVQHYTALCFKDSEGIQYTGSLFICSAIIVTGYSDTLEFLAWRRRHPQTKTNALLLSMRLKEALQHTLKARLK